MGLWLGYKQQKAKSGGVWPQLFTFWFDASFQFNTVIVFCRAGVSGVVLRLRGGRILFRQTSVIRRFKAEPVALSVVVFLGGVGGFVCSSAFHIVMVSLYAP